MLYQTSKDICEKLPGKREGDAGTWPRKYGNKSIFVLRKLKSAGKTEIIYNYGEFSSRLFCERFLTTLTTRECSSAERGKKAGRK